MQKRDYLRYLIVFLITLAIFLSVIWLSNYFNNKKLENIQDIQNNIYLDLMSSETQFQLLQGFSCKDVSANTLSKELNSLSEKISFSEQNIKEDSEITSLKKYYALLEIKDYLLMEKIIAQCQVKIIPIFYFYTTAKDCPNCVKESAVLTHLRQEYPELRIYSFDYNLDLSALQTMIKLFNVDVRKLPALYMNDQLYTGFYDEEDIINTIPALKTLAQEKLEAENATSTATSTEENSTSSVKD